MSDHGTMIDKNTLRFERLLPGPIERVWAYLTEADKRAKWFAGGEITPKKGGKLELKFDNSNVGSHAAPPPDHLKQYNGKHDSQHTVTIFEPPYRLGFDWSQGLDDGRSRVEFVLKEEGDKVRLTLTHSRLIEGPYRMKFASGWHAHLVMLGEVLADDVKSPFWSVFDGLEKTYTEKFGS
ncbi:MAG: SRPBCC family protein [Parvibaculum sp.]|nr:SRPBCC family protein [Parvibaculum sp.]